MAPRPSIPSFLPLDFSHDSSDPALPPEAKNPSPGEHYAVQDDRLGADPGAAGALRTAPQQQEVAAGNGRLRSRPEAHPRDVEGAAQPGEAGQRPQADRLRSPGTGDSGTAGPFAI